jgi:hypothetical protein
MLIQADGIHGIFVMFVPLGALCFVLSVFVEDVGLPDDNPAGGEARHPGDRLEDSVSEEGSDELSSQDIPEAIPSVTKEKVEGEAETVKSDEKIA